MGISLEEIEEIIEESAKEISRLSHIIQYEPTIQSQRDEIEGRIGYFRDKSAHYSSIKKKYLRELEKAKKEGVKIVNLEKAKKMLEEGIKVEDVTEITGLLKEEILKYNLEHVKI